jgi:hypothetical protein
VSSSSSLPLSIAIATLYIKKTTMILDLLSFVLLGNTITEFACACTLLLSPKLLTQGSAALWAGNEAVTVFGTRICGCALLALSMTSLLTLTSQRRVNKPVLFSLGFYHSVLLVAGVPLLKFNVKELQIPAAVLHSVFGVGALYCAFVGDEEATD